MAKTVAAGKTEIESFINSRIHAAGLEKLLEDENPLVAFQPGGGKTNE
ncbi:MAG: hypothetical protein GY814_01725, partial [Gammaproteobacteria bacterium]|nr:hypothetical protein [Gammaproteobacteria bacterium]